MARTWTFGEKLAGGFSITVALALVIALVGVGALRSVVASKDRVISIEGQNLVDVGALDAMSLGEAASLRGFLLSRSESDLAKLRERHLEFTEILRRVRSRSNSDQASKALQGIEQAELAYQAAADRIIALRTSNAPMDAVVRVLESDVVPKRTAIRAQLDTFTEFTERQQEEAKRASTETATSAIRSVIISSGAMVVLSAVVAFLLTRALGQRIGTAVGHVQSSSAELQAAANQQATGAREQAIAMAEITTTITELLATSKQIAESAQRVAQIAKQTAGSAATGDGTVDKAHDSISGIRKQVDLIVAHMLELGRKSQQIGGILEIVAELAEQTNILAINATIEAAGAGESGKRFAVVADEIRKLADRVAGSTKEIRVLIEDVRGSVNTTVMTTESGSKAVDAGAVHFGDVATAFKQIATLVTTTLDAAREIELSTKQQSTAVEQVNLAITNVAQATKETEASSGQILLTASQLAGLSGELLRLVKSEG